MSTGARSRGSLVAGLTLGLTAAATTWVAMLSWRGFSEVYSEFLGPLVLIGVVIAGTGALARWWRLPGAVVFLAQVALSTMLASLLLTGSLVPVGGAWSELVTTFEGAFASANTYASPVPRSAAYGVHPLLIAGGLASMLLVDLLACTARKVPLAGLPLLSIYSVPVSLLADGLSWWVFVLTATGFMTMLFLHESEQVARWGRSLGEGLSVGEPTVYGSHRGAAGSSARMIGGLATTMSVMVPIFIPTLGLEAFEFGNGPGGDTDISIENPMLDLRRDLTRGDDIPLLQVTTNDPSPDHLRISVLNRFSDNEWSSGDRDVPTVNLPDGPMPALEGVSDDVPREFYDYDVSTSDEFESTWLPTQAPISEIVADGDWRFDETTMDFIAGESGLTAAGMDYSMTTVDLDLDAAELATASDSATEIDDELLDLPSTLPPLVRELASGVTAKAPTSFQKAVALQNWFREKGGFTYSLEDGPVGNGVDELESFLSEGDGGRTGYCEQFAAAMAVMARALGIPARVAVGFLEPTRVGTNTFEYSAHDLHAWPELYFRDAGWVLFDPTPPDRVGSVPAYTTENVPVVDPTIGPNILPSEAQSIRPTSRPSASIESAPQGNDGGASSSGPGFPWGRTLGGAGGGLALVGLAMLPRLVRRRRREERLDGGPEEAWDELRATVIDLRLAWPRSRSPRETRGHLAEFFGAPVDSGGSLERPAHGPDVAPDAVSSMDRVVRDLELSRYSRGHAVESGALRDDVRACVEALEAGVTRRVRRRAEWLPTSVLTPPRRPTHTAVEESVPSRFGGVVEHI